MKTVATYNAKKGSHTVLITVLRDENGQYIPDCPELGMGHRYTTADRAASDLARRHGYKILRGIFT